MKLLEKMHKYKTMLSYCLKCKKNTQNINPRASKTSNGKTILLSKCATGATKKSKLFTKQQASGILSSLGFKTPFSKIPLFGDILLQIQFY